MGFLVLLFSLPFAGVQIKQFFKPTHWFHDYEAISCAGQTVNANLVLYAKVYICPQTEPTAYVYTPVLARAFGIFQNFVGSTAATGFYGAIFWVVVLLILHRLIADDRPGGTLRRRIPFLAGVPGNVLVSGNISLIIHGVVLLLGADAAGISLLLVITAASIIKPTFIVYTALFLFLKRGMAERLLLICACLLVVAGYFTYFYLHDSAGFGQWISRIHYYGLISDRGIGFLAMPFVEPLSDTKIIALVYVIFTAIVLSSGLILSEYCVSDEKERMFLGIATCLLLYPRLLGYDVFTLPFGLAVAARCFRGTGRFEQKYLWALIWLTCTICGVISLIGSRLGTRIFFDFSCLLLVFVAATAVKGGARHRLPSALAGHAANDPAC